MQIISTWFLTCTAIVNKLFLRYLVCKLIAKRKIILKFPILEGQDLPDVHAHQDHVQGAETETVIHVDGLIQETDVKMNLKIFFKLFFSHYMLLMYFVFF